MFKIFDFHVTYPYLRLLQNRIQFYFKLYKGVNIWGSLLVYILISFLLFQENQILGCAIILFHIHYTRRDITLLKVAYGEKYFISIIIDYILIYISFMILGFLIKDPLVYYSPIIFIFILLIFFTFPPQFSVSKSSLKFFCSLVSSTDFIWKSGIRSVEIKLWLIYLLAIPLMIGTRNPYIFLIFLFCFGLITNRFYNNEISEYILDIINNQRREAVKYIIKQNLISYFKITLIPFAILLILFYREKHFIFFVSSYFVLPILFLQFLLSNIKTYKTNGSSMFLQITNGFSTLSILFPPLSLVNLLYSLLLFKNINGNAKN